jgi:hypothetical protein
VNLLGIDSVQSPIPEREAAWARLARDLPKDRLDAMTQGPVSTTSPTSAARSCAARCRGRVVVEYVEKGPPVSEAAPMALRAARASHGPVIAKVIPGD